MLALASSKEFYFSCFSSHSNHSYCNSWFPWNKQGGWVQKLAKLRQPRFTTCKVYCNAWTLHIQQIFFSTLAETFIKLSLIKVLVTQWWIVLRAMFLYNTNERFITLSNHMNVAWVHHGRLLCVYVFEEMLLGVCFSGLNPQTVAQETLHKTKLFIRCDNYSHRAGERCLTASRNSSSI